jgi:hypothetical protein
MNNREIAQKIFEKLLEKGAGIGNASIPIIEKVLDESSQFEPLVILQEAEKKRMNVVGQKKQLKFMGQMLDMGWDKEQIPLLVAMWKNLRDEAGNLLASQSK